MSINSNGTVSLCFLDWSRKLVISDLKTENFKAIWNGDALIEYRKMHLINKRKDHPIRTVCGQLSHCLSDGIDPCADELLDKLIASRRDNDD